VVAAEDPFLQRQRALVKAPRLAQSSLRLAHRGQPGQIERDLGAGRAQLAPEDRDRALVQSRRFVAAGAQGLACYQVAKEAKLWPPAVASRQ
jgi:hypothetical protein